MNSSVSRLVMEWSHLFNQWFCLCSYSCWTVKWWFPSEDSCVYVCECVIDKTWPFGFRF